MEKVLHYFLLDVPRAAAIWVVLLVLAFVAMAGLVARWDDRRAARRAHTGALDNRDDFPTADTAELSRYAEEVAVAAERAAATTRRRRAEWLAAQDDVEAIRPALEVAEAAARQLSLAAAFPVPRTPQTPAEYADRERYLHRAAMGAYWRKELSVRELVDVLDHSNGWDPRRHPVEQELVLRIVVRDRLRHAERAAIERERLSWQAAETAVVAARTLREEAFGAAERVRQSRRPVRPSRSQTRSMASEVRQPQPAAGLRIVRAG